MCQLVLVLLVSIPLLDVWFNIHDFQILILSLPELHCHSLPNIQFAHLALHQMIKIAGRILTIKSIAPSIAPYQVCGLY